MADDSPSWFYADISVDPDRQGVLRNRFGLRSRAALELIEYVASGLRMDQIDRGEGPSGDFDAVHLRALHGYIFQDVYEWAGRSRDMHVTVEAQQLPPVEFLAKGGTVFLPGSRIEMGLASALADARPDELRKETPQGFADRAGKILGELNFVHPFREGNGRTQGMFISELGRASGYPLEWSMISDPHLIDASIKTSSDPDNPAMRRLVADMVVPGRIEALRDAFRRLDDAGHHPIDHYIRTAHAGEKFSGRIVFHNNQYGLLANEYGFIVLDRLDLATKITASQQRCDILASSDFSKPGLAKDKIFKDELVELHAMLEKRREERETVRAKIIGRSDQPKAPEAQKKVKEQTPSVDDVLREIKERKRDRERDKGRER